MSLSTLVTFAQKMAHLVNEKEVSTMNIISDSPISQYRNKTMFYLMKRFAIQQKIKLKWIYLEAGHGKGVADAIGAILKSNYIFMRNLMLKK
jgi:hypothetical protein